MATTYKVLGQANPSAATNTDIYTVPAGTEAVISTISVSNRTQGELLFRIAVRPNGATLSNEHYIAYDGKVTGQDSLFLTVGLTLNAADVVTVYSTSGSISFGVFGTEIA